MYLLTHTDMHLYTRIHIYMHPEKDIKKDKEYLHFKDNEFLYA